MLLLILLLVGSIVFTVIAVKSNQDIVNGNFVVQIFSTVASICCVVGFIIVLGNAFYSASTEISGYTAKMEEYRSIEYKLNNLDSYVDEFDINKSNVIEEIQEWNKTVKEKQILTHNVLLELCVLIIGIRFLLLIMMKFIRKLMKQIRIGGFSNVDWKSFRCIFNSCSLCVSYFC